MTWSQYIRQRIYERPPEESFVGSFLPLVKGYFFGVTKETHFDPRKTFWNINAIPICYFWRATNVDGIVSMGRNLSSKLYDAMRIILFTSFALSLCVSCAVPKATEVMHSLRTILAGTKVGDIAEVEFEGPYLSLKDKDGGSGIITLSAIQPRYQKSSLRRSSSASRD